MATRATYGPNGLKPHEIGIRVLWDDEDERAYQQYAESHPVIGECRNDKLAVVGPTREQYIEVRLRETQQANGAARALAAIDQCLRPRCVGETHAKHDEHVIEEIEAILRAYHG